MPKFSPEEQALLAPYVSDTDGDIFAITGLQGIVGAVFARYSRAQGGFRETLLKEFIKEGVIDAAKAQDLIEKILIAFGDDSVGELEGAHVAFENISIMATKELEDRRIGGSPIEQSTRYVFYDRREEPLDEKDSLGNYRYYRDPAVMASTHAAAYVETMDFIFQTYCELIEPMKAYYMGLKSIDEATYAIRMPKPGEEAQKISYAECADDDERKAFRITYNADIRTKACDSLRALLPIATKTNVGIYGNGRFFQHALSHCYTSAIPEANDLAKRAHAQLNKVIPRYVKRAKANEYQQQVRSRMRELAPQLFGYIPPVAETADVVLLDRGEDAIAETLANAERGTITGDDIRERLGREEDILAVSQMLFPHLSHTLTQIRSAVRAMTPEMRQQVITAYIGDRKTRRDRPGRALEAGYPYTFDLCTDFGTYKDLERHRMCSQERQAFTPNIGFAMPEDIVLAGFEAQAIACVMQAQSLYEKLRKDFPEQASYATLHGSKVRWTLGINDRALMHMIELRTGPQGHPSYRKVCQAMHTLVSARSSWRGGAIQFADHGEYFWSRGDAEAKQRVKEAALERG